MKLLYKDEKQKYEPLIFYTESDFFSSQENEVKEKKNLTTGAK